MQWIYRSIVLVLLTGSLVLNGLQYIGGAFINGVYTLVEGITDIASASMLQKRKITSLDEMRVAQQGKLKTLESVVDKQKRELGALSQKTVIQQGKLKTLQSVIDKNRIESALASQKRVAQRAKLSGLQSKVKTVIARIFRRGGYRVGSELAQAAQQKWAPAIPLSLVVPVVVATEVGFVYEDVSDQCDLLDDLNLWVSVLDFEPQNRPEYCSYTPTGLAQKFPDAAEFVESMKQTSVTDMMGDYGRQLYGQVENWGDAYNELISGNDSDAPTGWGVRIDSWNQKALDSWSSLRNSTKSFGQRTKGKWAEFLDKD
jgi:hypothetical protein